MAKYFGTLFIYSTGGTPKGARLYRSRRNPRFALSVRTLSQMVVA